MADEDHEDRDFPELPRVATDPCGRFARDQFRLVAFVGYVADLALRADKVTRIATEALAQSDRVLGPEETASEHDEGNGAIARLRSHRRLLLEMAYSRAVDNFLTYVSEMLSLLYSERPETLRAKVESRGRTAEAVSLDAILEHATMEDLIASVVEQRVTDLSFKGLRALADYLSDRLSFDLFDDVENLRRAIRIVETRNVIAHNRGVVSRLFLNRIGETTDFRLGEPIVLEVDTLFRDLAFLTRCTFDIDTRAAEKWSLTVSETSQIV